MDEARGYSIRIVCGILGAAAGQEKHAIDAEAVELLARHEVRLPHYRYAAHPQLLLLPLCDQ